MNDIENIIRLIFFLGSLILFLSLENIFPRREFKLNKYIRWQRNFSLILLNTLFIKIFIPFTTIGTAIFCQEYRIGLFNSLEIPSFYKTLLSVIILDFIIYAQHAAFHIFPIFWRIHKVHHIDQEIDATTGIRFHPLEIIFSVLLKILAIMVLGIPAFAALLFEILLNFSSLFTHSNLNLPVKLDKILRIIIVTPDMHRIHHSVNKDESQSNYGSSFSFWDKIFKSYKLMPKMGQLKMKIGLDHHQNFNENNLTHLLKIPFIK